ncbi:MAG: hypothetical protein KBT47_09290 [Armatimonadetes bacterium]|nr:hypothetical protein [Candidatus Hippobium faecium]
MIKKIFFTLIFLLLTVLLFSQDLSVPVTINSDGASLNDVCEYLSQQTGYNILAGKDQNEWIVYDRRAVIYADNVPLKDLMVSIADVYHLTWETDSQGTIYLTVTEEMQADELKKREEYFSSRKSKFSETQSKAYSAIMGNEVKNIYTDLFYPSDYRKNLVEFFNAFPQITEALMEKKSLEYKFSSLKENQKNIIKSLAWSYISFNKKIKPDLEESIDIFGDTDSLSFYINPIVGQEDQDIEEDGIFAKLLISGERNKIEIDILNPLGTYTDIIANAMVKLNRGEARENVLKSLQADLLKFKEELMYSESIPAENLTGEVFDQKINFAEISNREAMSYKEFYSVLHNKFGINIVADVFYRNVFEYVSVPMSLGKLIQNFSDNYKLRCVSKNNILEFQDKYYYLKIAGTVPHEWIDYWVVRAYENGGYTIEDLIKMANLNDIQIDSELAHNPDMSVVVDKNLRFNTNEVVKKRTLLRFLGSLPGDMLKQLFNGSLSAYELSDEQWNLLQDAMVENNGFFVKEKKSTQVIKLKRDMHGVIEYIFEYTSDFSSEPVSISLFTNRFTLRNKK